MGTRRKRLIYVLFIALLLSRLCVSCSLLNSGFINEYGQYVPKNPHYQYKDRLGGEIPPNLDTINAYKSILFYIIEENNDTAFFFNEEKNIYPESMVNNLYIKFYEKGKCLQFFSPCSKIKNKSLLTENDMNPNQPQYTKSYYYCKDNKVMIEHFNKGDGSGIYIIENYYLNTNGDTLYSIDKNSVHIFVKEVIPVSWKKYKPDW